MRKRGPNATVIAALITATLAVVVGIGGYPLAKHAWRDREAQRIRERYAAGLSPCDRNIAGMIDDIDRHLRPHVASDPDISITAFPSFSEPHGVRIVDGTLLYFRLLPIGQKNGKRDGTLNIRTDTVSKVSLSAPIATAIHDTLTQDIAHAHAELPLGLDGETYVFRMSDRRCAQTWSPDPQTRAGMWIRLFYALSEQAQSETAPQQDAKLHRLIERLETE